MQCKSCNAMKRQTDIISDSLNNFKDKLKGNVPFPLSPELLDVAAYRFGYDVDANQKVTNNNNHDSFWNGPRARNILLRLRFDEHCFFRALSCFKKGCECRFFFPFLAQPEETQPFRNPYIKATLFYTFDGGKHKKNGICC